MASTKISDLTAASSLTGTEVFPLVQSSTTKRTTLNSLINLIGGGGVPPITVPYFDHDNPTSIYHGAFWPTGVDLGPFLWESWIRYDTGAEYWISEGFGGAHALLAGFSGPSPSGNVWTGATTVSFSGAYTAQNGEWLHYAVMWDGSATISVLVNGIVVGTVAFTGPRRAQYGDLLIAGSDHSNYKGCIAQVRAWEGQNPISNPWYGFNAPLAERYFSDRTTSSGALAQFVTNYLTPTDSYPDLGDGFAGQLHPGSPRGAYNGFGFDGGAIYHPIRVVDSTAPFGNQKNVARTRSFTTPTSVPDGAKIWDSFGRADSIWAFTQYPTLGSTEGGSLGVKPWTQPLGEFGVFDGSLICGSQNVRARVTNDSADMDVRTGRLKDTTRGFGYASASARMTADRSSSWDAYNYIDYAGNDTVVLLRPDGTTAGGWSTPTQIWTHLRLVAAGTTFTVYVDDGMGGWTTLGSVTSETANQTEVGAGVYYYFGYGTHARITDFEVR